MIIGGAVIESYKSTRSWGTSPGSGTATLIVPSGSADHGIVVGTSVSFSFYGLDTFWGIVSKVSAKTGGISGTKTTVEMVDNRIRLNWMYAFCAFNMEDDTCAHGSIEALADSDAMSDSGASSDEDESLSFDEQTTSSAPDDVRFPPGYVVDPLRRRRYWSILPQHWQTGVRTYHDQPYTVRQILNFCFTHAVGHGYSFSRVYGARANQVRPLGIDWLKGASLASVISQMNDKTGMEVYISGKSQLVWDVKGTGTIPLYSGPQNPEYTIGSSMSTDPTRMRVMGGNSIVQVLNVELFPTWNRKWEKFMGEAQWRREVASRWDLNEKTHWAEIAAKAREVTLSEYCAKIRDYSFADYGNFGYVKRMAMSAWAYMEQLCFKHYAVPNTQKLFGCIPLNSVRVADALHCAVEMEGDGLSEDAKMRYQREPIEFYPGARAFIMAKGQPLDALDSRDIQAFHALRVTDTRKTWRVMQDYDIDPCGVGVIFKSPVFIDGDPVKNESIFLFPNRGQGGSRSLESVDGVDKLSDLINIVLPNGEYKIQPAQIKASFCFEVAPFFVEYGSGPRFGVLAAEGLTAHVLHVGSDTGFSVKGLGEGYPELLRLPADVAESFKEVLYADGDSAKEKSYAAWRSREGFSGVQTEGGFLRFGTVGTQLGNVVDRVSIDISPGVGVSETVDLIRARPTRAFIAEKTMQRLQRIAELYNGFESIKSEVRNLRRIVAASRYVQTDPTTTVSHQSFFTLDRTAIGGGDAKQTKVVPVNSADNRKAGEIVWQNEVAQASVDGNGFAGIVLSTVNADGEKVNLTVAYSGRVPVKLKGTFRPGGIVYAHPGVRYGRPKATTGAVAIGTYTHVNSPKDKEEYYGMVQLGFGGSEYMRTLQVYDLLKEEDEWKIKVRPGYIVSINQKKAQAGKEMIKYTMPTPLENEDEIPSFTVKAGEQIAVKVITDEKDIVTSAEIIVGKDLESKHSYPPPSGAGGEYYYLLASFRDRADPAPEDGAASVIEIEKLYHCGGAIYHRSSINELANSDEWTESALEAVAYELYVNFDQEEAKHMLRKIFQYSGEGIALLDDRGDNDYYIAMRRLVDLGSEAQITVTLPEGRGKRILIRGNQNDTEWVFTKNGVTVGVISFKDGLHTGKGGTIELCCPSSSNNQSIP